jgi:hypothetical protein
MSTIAASIKSAHTTASPIDGAESYDWENLVGECQERSTRVSRDWHTDCTTYTFADGSVIVIYDRHVSAYGCAE